MARDINENTVEFGRVVYVEPNNNINGTGRGTNFTFDPEDYSILVDLQVDVVDRFGYDNPDGNSQIQYTMEWDAKGSSTSLFKGTNGFLSTNALDTSFHDIKDNINQEAIGINSIEIRYNSWNYPEVTIQFTDIRGASLMATSDYLHEPVGEGLEKEKYADNFANTFFSTFFRFPYPRYTLLVKGFYGRPVSYSLCVNDFKTRFNSQTGNFDVTVSFIGYMYGLFTDIPMRLLFAAPYCEYGGAEYWQRKKGSGDFFYENEQIEMVTLIKLLEAVKAINGDFDKIPEVKAAIDENKKLEDSKNNLDKINGAYTSFVTGFNNGGGSLSFEETKIGKYLFIFCKCPTTKDCTACDKDGKVRTYEYMGGSPTLGGLGMIQVVKTCEKCGGTKKVKLEGDERYDINMGGEEEKRLLIAEISSYNDKKNDEEKIKYIPRIDKDNKDNPLKGAIVYVGGEVQETMLSSGTSLFLNVDEEDFKAVCEIIKESSTKAKQLDSEGGVAICILKVSDFKESLAAAASKVDATISTTNLDVKKLQEKTYERLLGFKVSLKNVIDMTLAHLDTFMECIYSCMDTINNMNPPRDFSRIGIDVNETDVESNVDTVRSKQPLYLPPFFGFRKINPETDEYEDAWIGDDPRMTDRNVFHEVQLIDGLVNGIITGRKEAEQEAIDYIRSFSIKNYGVDLGIGVENPTFVSDFESGNNPYIGIEPKIEDIVATFAYRCMLATTYSFDYPNIGNRFDTSDGSKKGYFEQFGKNDAKLFIATPAFKTFKENYLSEKKIGGNNILEIMGFDNFSHYLTGEGDEYIEQDSKNYLYFAGLKSPLFKKVGNSYVISCGDYDSKKVAVPMNYKSPAEATNIIKNIIFPGSGGTESNGFGVSREIAFPGVGISPTDNDFNNKFNEYYQKYESICNNEKKLQDIGLYFKKDYIWREYFSGKVSNDDNFRFPSIALSSDINDTTNEQGKLFTGGDGTEVPLYAKVPMSSTTNLKTFFTGANTWFGRIWNSDKRVIKNNHTRDGYIENNVVTAICNTPENATLYGLGCGDGTLFESEFYALQNSDVTNLDEINKNFKNAVYTEDEIKCLRMAFLFLHALPTSQHESLGKALETIIKRTYTPTITDIPISTMLFIGALYWRDRANGSAEEKTGPGKEDNVIVYGKKYEKAGSKQLITKTYGNPQTSEVKPLAPRIKNDKQPCHYLTIITEETAKRLENAEKSGKNDDSLRAYLEGNVYETRYFGFWDVLDSVKDMFIGLFTSWAMDDFRRNIDGKLSLRHKDGTRYTPEQIAEYKNIIFSKKLFFNKESKSKENYSKNGLVVEKNDDYNTFISRNFHEDLCKYHTMLGASSSENSLLTTFRLNSDPLSKINSILTNGCVIKALFPRVLMTRDMFSESWFKEVDLLKIGRGVLEIGWDNFKNAIIEAAKNENSDEEQNNQTANSSLPLNVSSNVKLSLYITLKNLHDKWLIATNRNKYSFTTKGRDNRGNKRGEFRSIGDNFFYINSFYEYVGDEIMINMEELPSQIEKVLGSTESSCSIYSFMYDVANQSRVQLLALPVFNDLSDPNYVREMFTPIPYDEIKFEEINTETQYVFLYPEEASKQLDMKGFDSRIGNERYKYKDDSFILVEEGGVPATDQKMPKTFNSTGDKKKNVPVIGVTFAKQNQSFFKNISVSMDNPKTTEVAILNTVAIAEKFKNGNVQATALGQDLFPIYSNYSYECSVEMMGCACIMPLMYFQLNNIPMFKGTYIIYNVSHSISPGNMKTTFVGQRLSRFRKKRNEDAISSAPDDVYNTVIGVTAGYPSNADGSCCTPEGKLEHDAEYNDMAKNADIDKNLLRAVEYAEVRYNGGFFSDNKLRVYYDPWQAFKYAFEEQSSPSGITTDNQFDTSIGFKNSYGENVSSITELANALAGRIMFYPIPSMADMMKASACTIVGAFGIPGQAYSQCGAKSITDFLDNSANGFKSQGDYFIALLNSNNELKTALKEMKWEEFAKLYKGERGIVDSGVYMPGDSVGFPKYVEALKEGYRQATSAGAAPVGGGVYVYSDGKDMHLVGNGINPNAAESIAYAQSHPLDVRAAAQTLTRNVDYVYYIGSCSEINKTGKRGKGRTNPDAYYEKSEWKGKKNVRLIDTEEHKASPGMKPAAWSISLCATYVKCALAAGGYPYFSCNGGQCGEYFEKHGFEEIYRSGANGETPDTKGFNSKWRTGDVMTIDAGKGDYYHEFGHVMMWSGTNWCSDFKQATCKTYNSTWKKSWEAGCYHVWRYRNIINK